MSKIAVHGGIIRHMNLISQMFYSHLRIGKNGKPFRMYKFRTMVMNADTQKKGLRALNEADGPVFKIRNDPRYTRIGRFLAHTGLDELPQLYNILCGDMALFGPRPLPVEEAAKLKPWQQKRHAIKPGIMSPWILEGYHSMKFEDWMKSDIAYIKQKSFWYDCKLAVRASVFLLRLMAKEIGI